MPGRTELATVAALLGDPSRAGICTALMGGEALPASELAYVAGIAAPTVSGHLAQLVAGGLLSMERHGRHRYYSLAGPEVATAIEALSRIAPPHSLRARLPAAPAPMRVARRCYDHLAGQLGVALAEGLLAKRLLRRRDGEFKLTRKGAIWFAAAGIDAEGLQRQARPILRACLDWSERRPHVAGALGAAVLQLLQDRQYVRQKRASRVMTLTEAGRAWLKSELDVEV